MFSRQLLRAAALLTFTFGTATIAAATPPVFNWTGLYVGANGGYGQAHQTINSFNLESEFGGGPFPDNFTGDFTNSASAGLFGGQIGFDYQTPNNLVLGVGASIDWGSLNGKGAVSEEVSEISNYTNKVTSIESISGRLGLAMGRWLPFVTGGLATAQNTVNVNGHTDTQTHSGWLVGGGLAVALGQNWSLWTQYSYMNLGSRNYQVVFDNDGVPPGANIGLTAQTIMVGLNYKVGWQSAH